MSDAWLIIGIFVFAFVLWVSTGGPNRPISFSGPFITPITDVDDTQEGYGDNIDWGVDDSTGATNMWSTRTIFGRFEGDLDEDSDVGIAPSVRVSIVGGEDGPSASEPRREQVTLRARNGSATITGWRLISTRTGNGAVIPESDDGAAIVLASGEDAVITTGSSSRVDSAEHDGDTWRIFLGERRELWRNSGDTIELIDLYGNVVDTYSY